MAVRFLKAFLKWPTLARPRITWQLVESDFLYPCLSRIVEWGRDLVDVTFTKLNGFFFVIFGHKIQLLSVCDMLPLHLHPFL